MRNKNLIADNIQPDELINLLNIGFKPVPLDENNKEVGAWTPIYENPDYWTLERLKQQAYKFKNVATVFGKTYIKDEEGRDLYLNCLDIDSDKVYDILFNLENSKSKQKYSLIPKLQTATFVTKTRRKNGFHIHWLSHNQNKPITTEDCKMDFEFEIKTDKCRGHCTLPPSKHRDDSNFVYKNYGQNKIMISDELYDKLVRVLADCLKDKSSKNDFNNNFSSKDGDEIYLLGEVQNISDLIHPYYKKGCNCRNELIYGITGYCRKNNVAKESAIKLVETLAKDDEEKRGRMMVLEQTYRKAPDQVSGIKKLVGALEHATGSVNIAREIFRQISAMITSKPHSQELEKRTDDVAELTDQIMKEYTFKTMKDTKEIYYYDDNLYVNGGEWLIQEHAEILNSKVRTVQVNEVINHIRRRTGVDRNQFDSNPDISNLQNGFLNRMTGQFTEHSSSHLSLTQLPVVYNPEAKCPNILKFLGEVLQPRDVFTALQIIGYCIYKNAKYEKAIMLYGRSGDNGKGTFIRLIESFVGPENTSHVSLQDLGGDKFAAADLYGKMVNTCGDISADKFSRSGIFKMLVSGDSIRAQRKYGQPFNFRNYSKLIFSANQIPDTEDRTFAFYKRWILLNFEKVFRENKDTNLIDKLTTPEELSGLLNLALIALKQLQKEEGFRNISIEETMQQYNKNADTTTTFIEEGCTLDPGNPEYYTLTTNVYNEYVIYCKEKNESPLEANVFRARLVKWGIKKERIRSYGIREYYYNGIKLKSDLEEKNLAPYQSIK
jgi:P4 family phage/plasmid primase-like protien